MKWNHNALPKHSRRIVSRHYAPIQIKPGVLGFLVLCLGGFLKRFWDKVDKSSIEISSPHIDTPCWVWIGTTFNTGYGSISFGSDSNNTRKRVLAHRVSYELQYGVFPEDLCVCHKCDNKSCVRGSHLFLGTKKENSEDMGRKGRNRTPRIISSPGMTWCGKCKSHKLITEFHKNKSHWTGFHERCKLCRQL